MMKFLHILHKIFLGLLLVYIGIMAWSIYIYISAPVETLRGIITYTPPYKNYTRKGGLGLPDNLVFEKIPFNLVLTVLAAEDIDFPRHNGFVIKRVYKNIENHLLYDKPLKSNSTITQQLAKNFFAGTEHSFYRKYVELIYALKIERNFTKAEIFTLYANIVETGPNMYGLKQAAHTYFNKEVGQLTDMECTFITSSFASPDRYTLWFREKSKTLAESVAWRMEVILDYSLILQHITLSHNPTRRIDTDFFANYSKDSIAYEPIVLENYIPLIRPVKSEVAEFVENHTNP